MTLLCHVRRQLLVWKNTRSWMTCLPSLQELKELLDRHKWAQAEYSFQGQQDDGGHICHVAVRDAGITGIVSQPCQNQRSAKSSAASQALSILLQKSLA